MSSKILGKLFINTSTAWLSTAIGMFIGFLLTPFLIKYLGNELYALQRISENLINWCCMLAIPIGTYASRASLFHFELKQIREMNNSLSNSLTIAMLSCIVIVIPLCICLKFPVEILNVDKSYLHQVRIAIYITGFGGIATIILRIYEASIFINQVFYLKYIETILSRILGGLLIFAYFIMIEPSLFFWLATITILPLFINIFWTIPRAMKDLPIRIKMFYFEKKEFLKIIKFSIGTSFGGIGALLFTATDSLLIAKIFGIDQITAYDLGARWMFLIFPLVDAYVKALSPEFVKCAAQNRYSEMADKVATGTRHALLLCSIPAITIAIVAQPFIRYWVGEEYVSLAVPIMRILLVSAIFMVPQMVAYHVLISILRTKENAYLSLFAGIFNLFISIVLATNTNLRIMGIAFGTLLASFIFHTLALPYFTTRYCKISWLIYLRETWTRPLIVILLNLFFGNLIMNFVEPRSIYHVIILIVFIAFIFSIVTLLFGLSKIEIKHIYNWIKSKN